MISLPTRLSRLFGASGILLGVLTLWSLGRLRGVEKDDLAAAGLNLFREQIKPILLGKCLHCHGPDKKKGGLDLSRRARLLAGGDNGPAVLPGKTEEGLLQEKVAGGKMPPANPLSAAQVAAFRAWIEAGAPYENEPLLAVAGSDWWAFQPIQQPAVPRTRFDALARTPVDRFLFAALEKKGLQPSPLADRLALLRRVTFDLTGLPPTPEEVSAFLADNAPDAYEMVVDRLLASPVYGERWARHYLDVVRFGESHGYEQNHLRPNAWPYRDYVIRAFNEDKPYTQFIAEQLAGDLVGKSDGSAAAATGFLVAGVHDTVGIKTEEGTRQQRANDLDDMVSTVGATFLGLSLNCARCHDHKFDPIPQNDYYRLAAVLAGVHHGERSLKAPGQDRPPAPIYSGVFSPPHAVYLLKRGDVMQRGEEMTPGALSRLPGYAGELTIDPGQGEAGRRLALARWLGDPHNPLTARVLVNRLWQHHFGQGIVSTPSDFGRNGARPTHPELLDYLAGDFMAGGWRLKRLHRLLVTSHAYRQASAVSGEGLAVDAGNQLVWHMPLRRLEAEAVRDAILAVSGKLDRAMGGPSFPLFKYRVVNIAIYEPLDEQGPNTWRRAVYQQCARAIREDMLASLDCPECAQRMPRRDGTTTPLQALSLLNGSFLNQQAEFFAERVRREAGSAVEAQVERAFLLAFGRPPRPGEQDATRNLVSRHGLSALCRVLFNANEFLYY